MADPFAPLGNALANLGKAFMSGPTPAEMQQQALTNQLLQARAANERAKAESQAREMAAQRMLADTVRQGFGPLGTTPRPDPGFVGPMPTQTRGEAVQGALPQLVSQLTATGNLSDLGKTLLALSANTPDVQQGALDRAMLGAGGKFDDTAQGTREGFANTLDKQRLADAGAMARTQFETFNDPVTLNSDQIALLAPGARQANGPFFGPTALTKQRIAEGQSVSPDARALAGAQGGTPRNFIGPNGARGITLDGLTDAATGAPIPAGAQVSTAQIQTDNPSNLTDSTQSAVQKDDLAVRRFGNLLAQTRAAAERDPTNFGFPGFVKGTMQDAQALAQGLAAGLGFDGLESAVAEVQRDVAANPDIDPSLFTGLFDPNLPALQTLSDLLVFSAAESLAGQQGRGISDRDVRVFKQIVGDPQSLFTSQEKFLAKLQTLEDIVNGRRQATQEFVGGTPAAPAPAATQPMAGARRIRIDAQGNIVQ